MRKGWHSESDRHRLARLGIKTGRKSQSVNNNLIIVKLKHGREADSKFNKEQLAMGIKVEMEHTNNKEVAEQIAKAHLVEIPDYYTRLKRMEMK